MLVLPCRMATQGYHSVCVTHPAQKLLCADSCTHGSIPLSRQVLVIPQHKKRHSKQELLRLKISGSRLRDQKGFKQNSIYYPVMPFIIKPKMVTAVSCLSPCFYNSNLSLQQWLTERHSLPKKYSYTVSSYDF